VTDLNSTQFNPALLRIERSLAFVSLVSFALFAASLLIATSSVLHHGALPIHARVVFPVIEWLPALILGPLIVSVVTACFSGAILVLRTLVAR